MPGRSPKPGAWGKRRVRFNCPCTAHPPTAPDQKGRDGGSFWKDDLRTELALEAKWPPSALGLDFVVVRRGPFQPNTQARKVQRLLATETSTVANHLYYRTVLATTLASSHP